MSARPLGHGPIRWMGNFKAIQMDYEYYLTLSPEGSLYCLTDRQIYILLAQLDYVSWITRWYNTDDITQQTVGFIRSELELALLSCVDVTVLVEQGKLSVTRDVTQQQIQSQQLRDVYADEYDGSPTSINPDAPTSDFGSTGDRFDALCAALMAFVYQFARGQVQAVVAGDIGAFALLAGAAILLIPGLNIFFAIGASIALLVGGGIIGVSTGTAVGALTDTAALNNVVCFMRDTLKALSVTEANWGACLNSYPFSVGSHEAIICDFIKPTLSSNYFTILDMLGQAYTGLIDGQPVPECPCEPPPPESRTPIIDNTIGEEPCGMLSGPDVEGFYVVSWTIGAFDWRASIMDIEGRPFRLEGYTFDAGVSSCQVFERLDTSVFFGCPGTDEYGLEGRPTIHSILWTNAAVNALRFKMVAP